jgi:Peptidase C13 family
MRSVTSTHGRGLQVLLAVALCLSLATCVSPQPPAVSVGPLPQPRSWKALLIAGDDAEPAFDNAVDVMADKLETFGVPRANIMVLKASGLGTQAATAANIMHGFTRLDPSAAEGCFIFITSHGAPNKGLVITSANTFLNPDNLDSLLNRSCGTSPTVVIASGCFSRIFAEGQTMPAANRIILTAARDDRASFGCNAKRNLTLFDQCALSNLDPGLRWHVAMGRITACVATNERTLGIEASSSPQISVGAAVVNLRVF